MSFARRESPPHDGSRPGLFGGEHPALSATSAFRTTSGSSPIPSTGTRSGGRRTSSGAFVLETAVVGLGMALVLQERFLGRPVMRSPAPHPLVALPHRRGLLWIGLLDVEFGALNGLLHRAGLIDSYISSSSPASARSTCSSLSTCGTRRRSRHSCCWRDAIDPHGASTWRPRWTAPATGSASAT